MIFPVTQISGYNGARGLDCGRTRHARENTMGTTNNDGLFRKYYLGNKIANKHKG